MRLFIAIILITWCAGAGCADVPVYTAETVHAKPAGLMLPAGASIAVLATGLGAKPAKGAPDPRAVSERLIRVLSHRGYRVTRITEAGLSSCDADYVLRLHSFDYDSFASVPVPGYAAPSTKTYAVTVDVLGGRDRRHLGRARFLLRRAGSSNDGPTAEDRALWRTLSWLAQHGTLEPWRPEPPRNGAFFLETQNATALFSHKTVKEQIPYYRPGPDFDRISVQSLVFGVSFIYATVPLELTLGCGVSGLLGGHDVDGAGPHLGLEYTLFSPGKLKTTIWGHGQAALLSREQVHVGFLLQAAAGAGLSWSQSRVLRLFARAGLGYQSLGTHDLDVIWGRPRAVVYDSVVLVLEAGFSLNW